MNLQWVCSDRQLVRNFRGRNPYWPNMPLRVTMTCFGCSSTGRERTKAATSSAVFHFASCPRRFWPAQTLVWIIFKNSCPERGLKMKIAPSKKFEDEVRLWERCKRRTDRFGGQVTLEGFMSGRVWFSWDSMSVTKTYIVTRYTLVSSTNPGIHNQNRKEVHRNHKTYRWFDLRKAQSSFDCSSMAP
jgi:hypothetical protein